VVRGLRWNVEVTFDESRRHLGVETQRQWSDPVVSDRAIARTTPVLLGLFSLSEATFSDVLARVRRAWLRLSLFQRLSLQG
jgi:hypothetical protein